MSELASALGIEPTRHEDLGFVAGTMFFARVDALTSLLGLGLDEQTLSPKSVRLMVRWRMR